VRKIIDLQIEKARLELQETYDRYCRGEITEEEFNKALKEADKKAHEFVKKLKEECGEKRG